MILKRTVICSNTTLQESHVCEPSFKGMKVFGCEAAPEYTTRPKKRRSKCRIPDNDGGWQRRDLVGADEDL